MNEKPSFRNEFNQRYTRQLFWDQHQLLPAELRVREPIYALHRSDLPGITNFGRVYVQLGDPTGYKVSNVLLEDFSHFNLLMRSEWFREAKAIWDAELEAKLASEGLDAIRMFADGIEGVAPAVQLTAARYLADKGWQKKEAPKRGRPSKEEVKGELKRSVEEEQGIADDLARIRKVK